MKTILVTGGTGFIGNCSCKLLLAERPEYRVINVDVCTYAANPSTIESELKNPNYKFYKTDIRDREAIDKIFGDKEKNPNLLVSSTKSMHGHMLGATGAVEGIVCVKTITDGKVPPTINLDNQDEHVANLDYVPHKAREKKVHAALSNSFGFGGHNATLVFKEV